MASPIPASVSRRKRLVLAGDIFLGLAIVAAALHFFTLSLSNLLWPIAGIAATIYTTSLRQSIRHLDAPTTEMDEYELRLHTCLLYTSPSPRDKRQSRMPSSA